MPRLLAVFEKTVVSALMIFMVAVIVLSTIDVAWVVLKGSHRT